MVLIFTETHCLLQKLWISEKLIINCIWLKIDFLTDHHCLLEELECHSDVLYINITVQYLLFEINVLAIYSWLNGDTNGFNGFRPILPSLQLNQLLAAHLALLNTRSHLRRLEGCDHASDNNDDNYYDGRTDSLSLKHKDLLLSRLAPWKKFN